MRSRTDHPSELLETTVIATALVFFAGWEYARAYYDVFDIRTGMLEFQVPAYFVWAYRPLVEHWPLALSTITALTVINHIRRTRTKWQIYLNLAFLLTLLLIFPGVSSVSRKVGNADALSSLRSPRDSFPLVTIHLKDQDKANRDAFQSGVGPIHGADYFLLGLHHSTYLLLPLNESGSPKPIFLPSDGISAISIRR